jgi:hypothetical protein
MLSSLPFTKEMQFDMVFYKIPNPNAKYVFFSTKYIPVCLCSVCGNYRSSQKSVCKRIFCTCLDDCGNDVYTNMCRSKYHEKFSKVLDALISKIYENDDDGPVNCLLSRYWHENDCSPCPRTCDECWRYWCLSCHSGLGGMYGGCTYKKCRVGRRNCGLTY